MFGGGADDPPAGSPEVLVVVEGVADDEAVRDLEAHVVGGVPVAQGRPLTQQAGHLINGWMDCPKKATLERCIVTKSNCNGGISVCYLLEISDNY